MSDISPITAIQTFLESADLTAARAAIGVPNFGSTGSDLAASATPDDSKAILGIPPFGTTGISLTGSETPEEALSALSMPVYPNLAAANAALNAGDIYFDEALWKFRSATA